MGLRPQDIIYSMFEDMLDQASGYLPEATLEFLASFRDDLCSVLEGETKLTLTCDVCGESDQAKLCPAAHTLCADCHPLFDHTKEGKLN